MNFKEYTETGYDLYAEFTDTVASIIRGAMELEDARSRLLPIQRRAKDQQSLRKKLEDRGILDENDIENSIKRSEEHTSELQSHSFISYAVFCLKKKKKHKKTKKKNTKKQKKKQKK